MEKTIADGAIYELKLTTRPGIDNYYLLKLSKCTSVPVFSSYKKNSLYITFLFIIICSVNNFTKKIERKIPNDYDEFSEWAEETREYPDRKYKLKKK